jgi:CHAT domain-containing protein
VPEFTGSVSNFSSVIISKFAVAGSTGPLNSDSFVNKAESFSISTDNHLSAFNPANEQAPVLRLTSRTDIQNLIEKGNFAQAVAMTDRFYSEEFEGYLGRQFPVSYLSYTGIQSKLSEMAAITGTRAVVIYTFVEADQLNLLLVPPAGKPIYKSVPAANAKVLMEQVRKLQQQIGDPTQRRTTSYLASSQQLYQWLIAPLEGELQQLDVDTLMFSMDTGLRTLPVAALHNGQQFLVEQYSLSLIPSLVLTDDRYADVRNASVLAMGMSQFPDQPPLPAVPVEIASISENLWSGQAFLNQASTLENLQRERRKQSFGIIHIATHGEFKPGEVNNSYIQLWGEKLRLDEMEQLKWHDPPVNLLVLSACRTAVGDSQAELGFAGLAVQTGASSALASMWYANDAGTLGLMSEFYKSLHSAPIKAEALRRAQIAMLQGDVRLQNGEMMGNFGKLSLPPELTALGNRNLKHPYYWAGFTMIGSPW